MCMPYPYRVSRCVKCHKESAFNWDGESYCAEHIPYKEMASDYLELLYDLMGKEWRDKELDLRFPKEEDFTWELCYYWAKVRYFALSAETGLLSFNP